MLSRDVERLSRLADGEVEIVAYDPPHRLVLRPIPQPSSAANLLQTSEMNIIQKELMLTLTSVVDGTLLQWDVAFEAGDNRVARFLTSQLKLLTLQRNPHQRLKDLVEAIEAETHDAKSGE